MIKTTLALVFLLLFVFELTSQNAIAQEPTFGPICDDVTVTCPPTPPVGQPQTTPTDVPPTDTPTVYPSETPVITSIPVSGTGGPTIGLILISGVLIITGHWTLSNLARQHQ